MKYSIYGSCVSRDIFGMTRRDGEVGSYYARSSLHSLFGPDQKHLSPDFLDNALKSWNERMLYADFMKDFSFNESVLIVDFIDERFRVLKSNNTILTESLLFQEMGLSEILNTEKAFNRGSKQEMIHWIEACFSFKDYADSNGVDVILHKAYFANKYKDTSGKIRQMDRLDYIAFCNELLRFYYQTFENIVKPKSIIECSDDFIVADEKHKWGLAPFHYVEEYYIEASNKISLIYT